MAGADGGAHAAPRHLERQSPAGGQQPARNVEHDGARRDRVAGYESAIERCRRAAVKAREAVPCTVRISRK